MKTNTRKTNQTIGLSIAVLALIMLTGSSQTAKAQQWNTNANNINNTNSGNVGIGIGTANPDTKLEVGDAITSSGSGAGLIFKPRSGSGATWQWYNLTGVSARLWNNVGGDVLTVLNGGNVGIGMTNPVYSLDVNGGVNAFRAKASTALSSDTIATFENSGGIQAIIRANGYVGIGTTNPGRPLVVTADASGIPLRVYRNVNNVGWGTGINWALNNSAGNVTDYAYVNSAIVSNTAGAEDGTLGFFTVKSGTLTQQAIIDQNGKVGIGTTAPLGPLDVRVSPNGYAGLLINYSSNSYLRAGATSGDVHIGDVITRNVLIGEAGGVSVGIGTPTPNSNYKLDVNGNTNVAGNISVTGTGNITAAGTIEGGNIKAKYQDVAEWVPASEQIPFGTVVVLDSTKSNHVIQSTQSYDTRVAGVISEQPGITLGESGANKVLVATTGRVLVKVDASRAPIHIGDLLVTSDIPGVAMKSEPVNVGGVQLHRPGTLIGKALEPLAKGSGKILVLLSLQ